MHNGRQLAAGLQDKQRDINIGFAAREESLTSVKSSWQIFSACRCGGGGIALTFVDVQHEAIEVDSLFTSVFHVGIKHIHEHGLPCA